MKPLSKLLGICMEQTVFLRIFFIAVVILSLLIPVKYIEELISERQATKNKAIAEISSKWGKAQTITGPQIIVPYIKTWAVKDDDGPSKIKKIKLYATFLPDTFNAKTSVTNETRYRGNFKVPLYQAHVAMSGRYSKPDFSRWGIDESAILWDEAELVVKISDTQAIKEQVYINWNNSKIAFEPGPGNTKSKGSGFHIPLKSRLQDKHYDFKINLSIKGSESIYLIPVGKDSSIQLDANWSDPSFQGRWLPVKREISKKGFNAQWKIPSISRNFPQSWKNNNVNDGLMSNSAVGVNFISPVDNYRMIIRSTKYASLFLLLTFAAIWVIEIISRHRVHFVQYLFIGIGMTMFFLLLLSFSEHFGFGLSYIVASILIIGLVTAYSKSALLTAKRASVIGLGITLLYGFLYSLLLEQNFALLIGSLGIFVAVSLVMFLTRNVDWYAIGNNKE